jgi:kynurenine 3-monooxygenase
MIDLAEAAGAEFEHKIWDVSLDTATLHIG